MVPVGARLLAVDDDEAWLGALVALLSPWGLRVDTVGGAEGALACLERTPYPLIISDVDLPGRSGLWLLERVRASAPATAVVLLTAHGSIPTAVAAIKLGASDFLTKPVDPGDLAATCVALVARAADAAPEAALATPGGRRVADVVEIAIGTPLVLVERELILRTLAATRGNKTAAAGLLGISRRSIYNKLAEVGPLPDAGGRAAAAIGPSPGRPVVRSGR